MECLFAIKTVAKGTNNVKYPQYILVSKMNNQNNLH